MTRPIRVRAIPTPTHGYFLIREPVQSHSAPMLVGFHGYAETAELQMDRLVSVPGADRWMLVSIQGLNRFYRGRSEDVVASWMTRQDRELAMADNGAYVSAVVESVGKECGPNGPLVFAGFSQGVAMAFRAACASARSVDGVIALGGDVPPEIDRAGLAPLPHVLLGRGERDQWYSGERRAVDIARLQDAGVTLEAPLFDAGHEWTEMFSRAAGVFLEKRLASISPAPPEPPHQS